MLEVVDRQACHDTTRAAGGGTSMTTTMLLAMRAAIIWWVAVSLAPVEAAYDAIETELDRRDVPP